MKLVKFGVWFCFAVFAVNAFLCILWVVLDKPLRLVLLNGFAAVISLVSALVCIWTVSQERRY